MCHYAANDVRLFKAAVEEQLEKLKAEKEGTERAAQAKTGDNDDSSKATTNSSAITLSKRMEEV